MDRALARSGRVPGGVLLIGAVKTLPVERVREAVALGLTDLGENRVQEAERKIAGIGRSGVRWHLIGHLQRNKVGKALECFDRIHGIDSLELAAALSGRAAATGRRVPALIEVNVSGEASKFGVAPDRLEPLLAEALALPGLAIDGLMTVGAHVEPAELARAGFARLRELRDRAAAALGVALPELSMGMSGDFDVAIEEGATQVRVGTALFGARPLGPGGDLKCS